MSRRSLETSQLRLDLVLQPLTLAQRRPWLQRASRGKGHRQLRIRDPACGSGSFLIEVYQHLLDWHRDWYTTNGAEKHSKGKNATRRWGIASFISGAIVRAAVSRG